MISTLFKSFKLTVAFCILFSVCYIFILWIFAQVAGPNKGNADVVELNGKIVGAANVGQTFTQDIYFWGRPSCAGDGYDASSSGGSNKGPSNEEPCRSRIPHRHLPGASSVSETWGSPCRDGHRQRFWTRSRYLSESRIRAGTTGSGSTRPLS